MKGAESTLHSKVESGSLAMNSKRARFLFVIGSNTTEAHPVLALRIKKAVRDGGTLVVADPRKIWLTKLAKRHLQLRPGTNVALLDINGPGAEKIAAEFST